MVEEFFAVTNSQSLYEVQNMRRPETGHPHVKKLKLLGKSEIGTGEFLSGPDGGPGYVGITRVMGLVLYWPKKDAKGRPENPSHTTTHLTRFGGHTAPIVALFFGREEAEECLKSKKLTPWDARWKAQTTAVLDAISNKHPLFVYDPWEPIPVKD